MKTNENPNGETFMTGTKVFLVGSISPVTHKDVTGVVTEVIDEYTVRVTWDDGMNDIDDDLPVEKRNLWGIDDLSLVED